MWQKKLPSSFLKATKQVIIKQLSYKTIQKYTSFYLERKWWILLFTILAEREKSVWLTLSVCLFWRSERDMSNAIIQCLKRINSTFLQFLQERKYQCILYMWNSMIHNVCLFVCERNIYFNIAWENWWISSFFTNPCEKRNMRQVNQYDSERLFICDNRNSIIFTIPVAEENHYLYNS